MLTVFFEEGDNPYASRAMVAVAMPLLNPEPTENKIGTLSLSGPEAAAAGGRPNRRTETKKARA